MLIHLIKGRGHNEPNLKGGLIMGILIFLGAQIAIGSTFGSIVGWELSKYLTKGENK